MASVGPESQLARRGRAQRHSRAWAAGIQGNKTSHITYTALWVPQAHGQCRSLLLAVAVFQVSSYWRKKFLLFGGRAEGAQGANHTEPPSTGLVAGKGTATGQGNSPLYPNLHLLHGHKTPELCEVSPN